MSRQKRSRKLWLQRQLLSYCQLKQSPYVVDWVAVDHCLLCIAFSAEHHHTHLSLLNLLHSCLAPHFRQSYRLENSSGAIFGSEIGTREKNNSTQRGIEVSSSFAAAIAYISLSVLA